MRVLASDNYASLTLSEQHCDQFQAIAFLYPGDNRLSC
jgi:hypothetical protein